MRFREGELTYHSRVCEGGIGFFITTQSGSLILIDGDTSCKWNSPYKNKFGETYSDRCKKWENFYLDETGGGQSHYNELKQLYMRFETANEIMNIRSKQEKIWRLMAI